MELKKIAKTLVAVHSFKTSLSKINDAVGVKPMQIMEALQKQNLEPNAPQIWNYIGCDGKMESEFTLEICFPVDKKGSDTKVIVFKELPPFNCLSYIHNGSWSEFGKVYVKIFSEMGKTGAIPTGINREVYLNCDFEDPSKCITEIQIEVK